MLPLPPTHNPHPHFGQLVPLFLNAKNVDLSGIQRLKLKAMQKVTKGESLSKIKVKIKAGILAFWAMYGLQLLVTTIDI